MTVVLKHRKSIRLKHYNYSMPGDYFITICTNDHERIFGEIVENEIQLSKIGILVKQFWEEIPLHFSNVELDEYVIMPNHIHGILILRECTVGAEYIQPLRLRYIQPLRLRYIQPLRQTTFQHVIPNSIPSIVRSFKAAVTRECRKKNYQICCWQRNYYEHIIRNEKELNNIRDYIFGNLLQWKADHAVDLPESK
jgi:putative transposase